MYNYNSKIILRIKLLAIILLTYTQIFTAETLPKNQSIPFKAGESLVYEFRFSRFPIYGLLGQIKMDVIPYQQVSQIINQPVPQTISEKIENKSTLTIQAIAETRGFFPSLLGLKVRDVFCSIISKEDLGLIYNSKIIDEGKRKRTQTVIFDKESSTAEIFDTNLSTTTPSTTTRKASSESWTSDILSFWYVIRTKQLEKDKVIPITIFDEGKTFTIDVVVRNIEQIEVNGKKQTSYCLEIKAYEAGFIRRKGEFLLWVSNDKLRVPLRVKFRTNIGTVVGELIQSKNTN